MGGANHFPWGKYLPLPSKQCQYYVHDCVVQRLRGGGDAHCSAAHTLYLDSFVFEKIQNE
jgi:hypothetical protein